MKTDSLIYMLFNGPVLKSEEKKRSRTEEQQERARLLNKQKRERYWSKIFLAFPELTANTNEISKEAGRDSTSVIHSLRELERDYKLVERVGLESTTHGKGNKLIVWKYIGEINHESE